MNELVIPEVISIITTAISTYVKPLWGVFKSVAYWQVALFFAVAVILFIVNHSTDMFGWIYHKIGSLMHHDWHLDHDMAEARERINRNNKLNIAWQLWKGAGGSSAPPQSAIKQLRLHRDWDTAAKKLNW